MIYFPGGGYIAGNLDTEDAHCRIFAAKTPCLVISVNYPKVPAVKLDDIINLGTLAVPWVRSFISVTRNFADLTSVAKRQTNWVMIRLRRSYVEGQQALFCVHRSHTDSCRRETIQPSPAVYSCLQSLFIGNMMASTSTCTRRGTRTEMLALLYSGWNLPNSSGVSTQHRTERGLGLILGSTLRCRLQQSTPLPASCRRSFEVSSILYRHGRERLLPG